MLPDVSYIPSSRLGLAVAFKPFRLSMEDDENPERGFINLMPPLKLFTYFLCRLEAVGICLRAKGVVLHANYPLRGQFSRSKRKE